MKKLILALVLLLPLLTACSSSDNITDIFVGKQWRMNYITAGGKGTTWYKFSDVTQSNYDDYTNRTKEFDLSLNGSESGDIITGTYTGSGALSAGGKWTANGDSRSFKTSENYGSAGEDTDILAQKILYGLSNVKSYTGDESNLYLYFDYNGETLFMAFSPKQ